MLKFKCSSVGFDCGFVAKGKSEDDILAQCAAHAFKESQYETRRHNTRIKRQNQKKYSQITILETINSHHFFLRVVTIKKLV